MMQKFAVLFVALTATVLSVLAQETKIIKFKQQPLVTRLQHYHIIDVKDDRTDTSSIGSVRAGLFSKKSVNLNFSGGAASAIHELLRNNLKQDTQTMPLTLHIIRLEVAESTGGLKAEGEVRVVVDFYAGDKKLSEYTGGGTISATLDATRYIEDMIRKALDNMVAQFDGWCANNKEELEAMTAAPALIVETEMVEQTSDTNQISFASGRPLKLEDFRGKPDDLSKAGAATRSGIRIKYRSEMRYSVTKIRVTIDPFFDRQTSWCRKASYNLQTLAHEQMHFNITAIKACELAAKIRSYHFILEKYQDQLEELNRENEKEVRDMQEQYDNATNHGLLPVVQRQWENRIRDSLQSQTCYHH